MKSLIWYASRTHTRTHTYLNYLLESTTSTPIRPNRQIGTFETKEASHAAPSRASVFTLLRLCGRNKSVTTTSTTTVRVRAIVSERTMNVESCIWLLVSTFGALRRAASQDRQHQKCIIYLFFSLDMIVVACTISLYSVLNPTTVCADHNDKPETTKMILFCSYFIGLHLLTPRNGCETHSNR